MLGRFFSKTLLCLSILIIFYTIYRSEFYWDGQLRGYYFKFYIIGIIFFGFSLFTFFINEKIREYFAIFLVSLYASVTLFEIYLSFKFDNKYYNYPANYDLRSPYEFFLDRKKINPKVKMVIKPFDHLEYVKSDKFNILPLSGFSNSETINCNENGFYSIYNSDRYGFNNPDNVWDEKVVEYLLIGDSFLHGACVNRPNDIASVLRNLTSKNVINLGFRSNGPLLEFASLKEYLPKKTKNIIWFYYEGNDLKNLKNELKNPILKKYLQSENFTQNLKQRQKIVDLQNKYVLELNIKNQDKSKKIKNENIDVNSSKTFKIIKLFHFREIFLKNLKSKIKKNNKDLSNDAFLTNQLFQILNFTKELAFKNKINFYLVYIPDLNRYTENQSNKSYRKVIKKLKENKINIIDLKEDLFELEKNPLDLLSHKKPGHFNILGYKKISNLIFEKIKN